MGENLDAFRIQPNITIAERSGLLDLWRWCIVSGMVRWTCSGNCSWNSPGEGPSHHPSLTITLNLYSGRPVNCVVALLALGGTVGFSMASVGTTGQLAAASTPPAPSGAVYAWGDDEAGQLANGNVTVKGHNYDEKSPEPADMPAGTLAVSLAAGQSHSLAATTTGSVFAWGFNGNGQLGTGNTNATTLPVPVAMPPGAIVISVAAGFKQSYALTSSGQIYAWGLGQRTDSLAPARRSLRVTFQRASIYPPGSPRTAIAGGGFRGLAVGSDGNIYSWGLNDDGQLGDGSTTNSDTPIAVTLPYRRRAGSGGGRRSPQPCADLGRHRLRLGRQRQRRDR